MSQTGEIGAPSEIEIEEKPQVRVAIINPQENSFYSSSLQKPQLFRGSLDVSPSVEQTAHQIVRQPHYGLPPMSSLYYLGHQSEVAGYALRPAYGYEINLRNFIVKRYNIDQILEDGGDIDPVDLALLGVAHTMMNHKPRTHL